MRFSFPALLCAALAAVASAPGVFADEVSAPREIRTRHFLFQYEAEHEQVAAGLARIAEKVRTRHCSLIRPCYGGTITVKIARTEDEFLDLQPYNAHIDWAAGVAYSSLSLVILRMDKRMLLSISETFEHEVSHILLLNAVKKRPPRWFIEGLAIHQAGQNLVERFERVAAATMSDGPFPFSELVDTFPEGEHRRSLAYAQSGLFVSYMVARFGIPKTRKLVRALAWGMPIDTATRKAFGTTLADLEEEWVDSLGSYAWLMTATSSWTVWGLLTLLFLLAVVVKRRRTVLRKREMEREEADWEYMNGGRSRRDGTDNTYLN